MDLIQKNLLTRALNKKLGHFFIISPPGRAKKPKEELLSWCSQLVSAYFEAKSRSTKELKNNEDVLIIDEDMVAKKFYDKVFIQSISQFLSHSATIGDRKFIIIEDMERMSPIHSNKLLKIFEEPPVNATIFLLNPAMGKPLPTISSRAVNIRVKIPVDTAVQDLGKWIKKVEKKDLHQFCDYFKARKDEEKELAKALMDNIPSRAEESLDTKRLFQKIQKYLKFHTEDSLYNHNSYARLTVLREIYLDVAAPSQS